DWNWGPSPAFAQSTQPFCNGISTVIVKSETINQRFLVRQPKDARLGISWLSRGGHGADLDETKSKRRPCRQGDAVFVQPGGKANWIRKGQAKQSFWFRRRRKTFQRPQHKIEMRSSAKRCDTEMMCGLCIKRKQQRPNESFVEAFHVNRCFNAQISFPDAKLTEHRVENLFHVNNTNYFANCTQRVIKMNRGVFRREPLALCCGGTVA